MAVRPVEIETIDSGRKVTKAGTDWPILYSVYRWAADSWQVVSFCDGVGEEIDRKATVEEALQCMYRVAGVEPVCKYCKERLIELWDARTCAQCDVEIMAPITREACEQIAAERGEKYHSSYRQLGGSLPAPKYREALIEFLYHTHDIYISGMAVRYESREQACQAVQVWLNEHAPGETVNRIFYSVDSVDAYT